MARSIECMLWANRRWERISIDVAVSMPRGRRMRCVECGGAVRAHAEGTTGQAAHFEHRDAHPGCSLGNYFDGTLRPHPKAMR